MSLKITYTLQLNNGPEMMMRKNAKYMTAALESLGKWWFQERLEKHFERDAKRAYGYAERKSVYKKVRAIIERLGGADTPELMGISNPKKGKQRGQLKRTVKQSGLIRASSKKVTVTMQAPPYANMRSRDGQGPDKVAEIISISADEKRQMTTLMERWLARMIDSDKETTVKRFE